VPDVGVEADGVLVRFATAVAVASSSL